ncbi:hypothetical protein AGOR_G00165960 [Albula goreensis]|uniref:PH domain-containing protein n=1 Tax=Albula goreensis TaxID=1534307 RepID=A0A8T3CZV2_9TELE|nr:hypothetical protein AGOR_G00165960 [Albula goreensis]
MEDGVKGDTTKPREAKFVGKEGWVKKSSGKFLGSYKDRYIQVEKTEIVVYESEDLKNCLERVDLENFDKCHELRSAFKKKNRLILIRAPKSGNKVQDVKIQAQNVEDKDAWIKALSDGINRAKNKIFDEVKVDESCSLEHVTRSRPKGNQGRRPPTRIHMKEVATLSSDGILRKDLDSVSNTPNGTHQIDSDTDTPKEAVKPPMPPSKPVESPQLCPDEEAAPQKKILKPPMPPSKWNKPSAPNEGETPQEAEPAGSPVPQDKPCNSSEEPDSTLTAPVPSLSPPPPSKDSLKPPMPPSKDKKPAQVVDGEAHQIPIGTKDNEEQSLEGTTSDTQARNGSGFKRISPVPEDPEEDPAEQEYPAPVLTTPEEQEPDSTGGKSTEPLPEPVKKSSGPSALPKKKPATPLANSDQPCDHKEGLAEDSGPEESKSILPSNEMASSAACIISDGQNLTPPTEAKDELAAVLSSGDSGGGMVPPDLVVQRTKQEVSKSYDSKQFGDESEVAFVESDGQVHLVDGVSEGKEPVDGHVSQKGKAIQSARSKAHMLKQMQTKRSIEPNPPALPLKPSSKGKSASMGDLLSEPVVLMTEGPGEEPSRMSPRNDTNELQSRVALELEDTVELLDAVTSRCQKQGFPGSEGVQKSPSPEELLAKAVEKLRKADQFLQEAKSLRQVDTQEKKHRRMSW